MEFHKLAPMYVQLSGQMSYEKMTKFFSRNAIKLFLGYINHCSLNGTFEKNSTENSDRNGFMKSTSGHPDLEHVPLPAAPPLLRVVHQLRQPVPEVAVSGLQAPILNNHVTVSNC
jgi:hypothetical protein